MLFPKKFSASGGFPAEDATAIVADANVDCAVDPRVAVPVRTRVEMLVVVPLNPMPVVYGC